MGILSRLFGKSGSRPSGGGRGGLGATGKISVYGVVMQTGSKIATKRCDIDGRTFPCPKNPPSIFTLNTDDWVLDIGGYCPSCRGYRCEQHVKFGDGAEIVCARCGTAVTGGP